MALQELNAPPPITGLATLGATIANAGDQYRQRAQQLQDVASARAFTEREGDKQRAERLQDEQTLETFRSRQAGIQILINEGLLDGSQRDNPQAVAAAYQRAQREGIDKLYIDLTTTPDPQTGKPLLTQADVNNPALVQAAKDKLGAVRANQIQAQMAQPANAQATVDSLAQQLSAHQQRIAQISAKLDEPARQYAINEPSVQQLAVQLAEQAKPGSGRDRAAVAAMLPIAQKQLNDQATLSHMQDVQAATRQLDGERYAEASITQALDHAIQASKIYPTRAAMASPASLQQPTTAAAPKVANAADIAAAMRAVVGGTAPAAAATDAPSGPSMLANPTNEPTIDQENQRRTAQIQQTTRFDPYNATLDQLDEVNRQISSVKAGSDPQAAYFAGADPSSTVTTLSPTAQASLLSDLLQKQQALQQKAAAAKRGLFAPLNPTPLTPPAPGALSPMNGPTASTPTATPVSNWWQSDSPPPVY